MKFVILLVAIVIFYLAYVIKKKNGNIHTATADRPASLEKLEQQAEYFRDLATKERLGLDFSEEKMQLDAMSYDYIRLRERFKHDNEKLKQIAVDWYEYCNSMYEVHTARELLDVATGEEDPYDEFEERVKGPWIKIHEIEKRYEEDLGNEAQITHVSKQLEEKRKNFDLGKEIEKIVQKQK